MSLRIRLIAEGSGDLVGEGLFQQLPNHEIEADELGAAQVLVRRVIGAKTKIPEAAVRFLAPPQSEGRVPRGSELLDEVTLLELLAVVPSQAEPDLMVVIVDADGDGAARRGLLAGIVGARSSHIVGIAVEEFESWLVADADAVARVSGSMLDDFDRAIPGEAKKALKRALVGRQSAEARLARRSIAEVCAIDSVRAASPSFDDFAKRIVAAAAHRTSIAFE